MNDGEYSDSLMPINYVMLAVVSGIIGIVLAGFTGWHILLASRGQTTIECLEKTRYLSPVRKSMRHRQLAQTDGPPDYGQQYREMNHMPSARPDDLEMENGQQRQYPTYDVMERERARQRYEEYLDEQDSEKLPSAFDLGPRRNFIHLFGTKRSLWPFPVPTTIGDGWSWEPSPKWLDARQKIAREREEQRTREEVAGWGGPTISQAPERQSGAARHYVTSYPSRPTSKADRILGRNPNDYADEDSAVSMRTLNPTSDDEYEVSSDEEQAKQRALDRKASKGWPEAVNQVGIVTNTLLGNTMTRHKDDGKDWHGIDDGVD